MVFVDTDHSLDMNKYIQERGATAGLHPLEQMVIAAMPIWCSSEPGRIKHTSLRHELSRKTERDFSPEVQAELMVELYKMVPEVIFEEPEMDEDHVKSKAFIDRSDKRIATLKGNRGRRADRYAKERAQLSPEDHESFIQWLGGELDVSYANDVMTSVRMGDDEWKEFKPGESSTKEDIHGYLHRTIGSGNQSEGDTVHTRWYASRTLHEAKTDTQVVKQDIFDLEQIKAPDSFLNALIYGIYDPKHPVDSLWAWRFMNLYVKGTPYSTPNSDQKPQRHEKNWGGWTPEEGMPLKSLQKVNAGRRGDSIPFIEFLLRSVNGIQRGDPRYEETVKHAIKGVRGKAIDVQYLLRRLLETIATLPNAQAVANFQGDPEFQTLARELAQDQAIGGVPADWKYSGRTLDISGGFRPIDQTLYTTFVISLLGMRGIQIQTSDIIL